MSSKTRDSVSTGLLFLGTHVLLWRELLLMLIGIHHGTMMAKSRRRLLSRVLLTKTGRKLLASLSLRYDAAEVEMVAKWQAQLRQRTSTRRARKKRSASSPSEWSTSWMHRLVLVALLLVVGSILLMLPTPAAYYCTAFVMLPAPQLQQHPRRDKISSNRSILRRRIHSHTTMLLSNNSKKKNGHPSSSSIGWRWLSRMPQRLWERTIRPRIPKRLLLRADDTKKKDAGGVVVPQHQEGADATSLTSWTSDASDDNTKGSTAAATTTTPPPHEQRWAVAANTTDLSGIWKPIITPQFRKEYDEYLQKCGEGVVFRRAMLGAIGFSKEVIAQIDGGRSLCITGTTPIGQWRRVLVASGHDNDQASSSSSSSFEPVYTSFQDPDGDTVTVESWWEDCGRRHKSWLRGKPRVLGGEFESTRYLLEQPPADESSSSSSSAHDVLVCESVFHPPPPSLDNPSYRFAPARVEWRFQRHK